MMSLLESDRMMKTVHQRCNCLVTHIVNCVNSDESTKNRLRSAFYKFMITTCSEHHIGYDDNEIITNIDDALSMLDSKLLSTIAPEKGKVDHFVVDEGGSPFLEVKILIYGIPVLQGRFNVATMRLLHSKRAAQLVVSQQQ